MNAADTRNTDATNTDAQTEHVRLIRSVNDKRAFWRHVSFYVVFTTAFWLSWVVGGIRDEWVAPWPLIPTVVWGLLVMAHERHLGGAQAISHQTIDREVAQVLHPDAPVFRDRLVRHTVEFGDATAYRALPAFHLQDVIDARDPKTAQVTDEQSNPLEVS